MIKQLSYALQDMKKIVTIKKDNYFHRNENCIKLKI